MSEGWIWHWIKDHIKNPFGRLTLIILFILSLVLLIPNIYNNLPNYIKALPVTIITALLIGFILDTVSLREHINQSFKEHAIEFIEAHTYSVKALERILEKVMAARYNLPNVPLPPNNIFDFINKKVLVDLGEPYYSNMKITTSLKIQEKQVRWIHEKEYEIESLNSVPTEKEFKIIYQVEKINGAERQIWFEGDYIEVEGNQILDATKFISEEKGIIQFEYKYKITTHHGKKNIVKLRISFLEKRGSCHIVDHSIFLHPTNGLNYHLMIDGSGDYNISAYTPGFISDQKNSVKPREKDIEINYVNGWIMRNNTITILVTPK